MEYFSKRLTILKHDVISHRDGAIVTCIRGLLIVNVIIEVNETVGRAQMS